ncbi:carboxypeptidase-like regulatory domain-containing protein [Mucilaginibacter sabulilitoris]|uniref:Carboxypeptidase-like regulatory domain-containing protein n=1 Tax=Mucilaginibacter sabulilitoris TaxID=1173583 RepID=A0ABZ0TPH9_9SPHI|nr:carboxypeptidase-like regulatory domain-containing protein [Mucilaginibacter sabulilitoris]WPU95008.1 carboxypeptidase-like regulatory domain-containing protein [Mucilaginibacter sabulilitoris]
MIITATKFLPPRQLLLLLMVMLLFGIRPAQAQSILNRRISIQFDHARLADALRDIGKKGEFYFSYNGRLLSQDSLITMSADNQTISDILVTLFHGKYDIEERNNYLIITQPLPTLSLLNTDITNDNNTYSISGLVIDERTGERLMNASVYIKEQLASALTDEHGYFKLKFRADHPGQISLTASKLAYRDTSINFLQAVSINSRSQSGNYDNAVNKSNRVERTAMGHLFSSAKQRIQSLNIPDFFAKRPFQVSLTPGLSSHGMFSPQVVNKFSLNLIGGYTAGVNGFEFGGLFNINKMDSKYMQLAGVFNLVGGTVTGIQAAGVHNRALDTVRGLQVAGFINKAESEVEGMQVAGLHNEAGKLKGLQIGLVNRADTSKGASIGLVNIIGNGFYKVTLSSNDLVNTNVSLKTGTHAFYSTVYIGSNISPNSKLHYFGLGLGHDFMLSQWIYFSTETAYQFVHAGSSFDDRWLQGKLLLNIQLSKSISLVGGPTFNHYNHSGSFHIAGFKNVTHIPEPSNNNYLYEHQVKKWVGWEAGVAFNSVFSKAFDPALKAHDNSSSWYLGASAGAGIIWDDPFGGAVYSGEIFTHRDLGEHITGTFSVGYTSFSENDYTYKSNYLKFIPVKAGIRLYTGKTFFIGGEVGAAFGLFDEPYSNPYISGSSDPVVINKPYRSLTYGVSAGFSFHSGLETSFKFEDYGLQSYYKQFALRLGYRFKLGK